MLSLKRNLIVMGLAPISLMPAIACNQVSANAPRIEPALKYSWAKVIESAAFPGAYNFPVFTMRNQMWAFHHELPCYHPPATAGGTDLGSPALDCKYLLRRISV
jgi:hypothetical protein